MNDVVDVQIPQVDVEGSMNCVTNNTLFISKALRRADSGVPLKLERVLSVSNSGTASGAQ